MKTLHINNIPVLTSGSPADIATIAVPSEAGRFTVAIGGIDVVGESVSGALSSAAFDIFDQTGGAGSKVTLSPVVGPSMAGAKSQGNCIPTFISTSRTLFVRQVADSANSGTCSFYVVIVPLP